MDVKNLKLWIYSNYGEVRVIPFMLGAPIGWGRRIEVPIGVVDAHSKRPVRGLCQFHAIRDTGGQPRDVVRAYISDYDVSFDHMLVDETTHRPWVGGSAQAEIHNL